MRTRRRVVKAAWLALAATCAAGSSVRQAAADEAEGGKQVTLTYTVNNLGYIETCG